MAEVDLQIEVEAVLFVAPRPLSAEELAAAIDAPAEDVAAALDILAGRLANTGISLSVHNDKYRLVSAPAAAATVRRFLGAEASSELSKPALETLAIVAYRGPITKHDIEDIRGVASDAMLRQLLGRGLIEEAGKSSRPGRPVAYTVTHTFLHRFGLSSISELPQLAEDARAH